MFRRMRPCAGLLMALASFSGGCRSTSPTPSLTLPSNAMAESRAGSVLNTAAVSPVAYHQQIFESLPQCAANSVADDPFAGQSELSLEPLISEVQARNPSLQAMVAAWRASAERYPQVVSLEDPMFGFMLAPDALARSGLSGGPGYMLEASQKLPWFGKRDLRGQAADAEASAMRLDVDDARFKLIEMAKLAYLDYYLVQREREINSQNGSIVQDFREIALAKYRGNLVTEQDVLQSDVELAELKRRQIELERVHKVAIARINTLLHRAANHVLPPPLQGLPAPDLPVTTEVLQQWAMNRRPDLAALGVRVRAEQAAADLATKEFCPDVEVVGRYDTIGMDQPYRGQVGLNVNIPLYRDRRRAAVREAEFKVSQRRAEYEQRLDDIHNDVEATAEQAIETRRIVALYHDTILPAAEQNVEAAKAAYSAGKLDFLRLIDAQRQLIMLQEKRFEAQTDYHRRLAELERVVAGPLVDLSAESLPLPHF